MKNIIITIISTIVGGLIGFGAVYLIYLYMQEPKSEHETVVRGSMSGGSNSAARGDVPQKPAELPAAPSEDEPQPKPQTQPEPEPQPQTPAETPRPEMTLNYKLVSSADNNFLFTVIARATMPSAGALVYTITGGSGALKNGSGIFENLSPGNYSVTASSASDPGSKVTGTVTVPSPVSASQLQTILNSGDQYDAHRAFFESGKFVKQVAVKYTDEAKERLINSYNTPSELMRQIRMQIWSSITVVGVDYNDRGVVKAFTITFKE